MKRFVLSSPFAVVTFVVGMSGFVIAGWLNPVFDVPEIALDSEYNFDLQKLDCSYSDDADRKAVYSVILSDERYGSEPIVLEEFTERGGLYMDDLISRRDVEGADLSTIENYQVRNKESKSLRGIFADRKDIIFFTQEDAKVVFTNDLGGFEERFAHRFRGTHRKLSLSDVGFNANHTEALVYVSYYCGGLCAGGSFVILYKSRGQWTINSRLSLWVS